MHKRLFLKSALAVLAATTSLGGLTFTASAAGRELSDFEKKLMEPGPMPEMSMGDAAAPITIVEYASMTCGHCAHFAATTWPILRDDYIKTGKVFYIMREFPLDPLAAAGFMIARNAPGNRQIEIIDTLFLRQKEWAFVDNPVEGLRTLAKQFGYSPATFDATLKDQKLLDNISAVRSKGADVFGIDSTPTFFINGEKVKGSIEPEDLKLRLEAILANLPKG